MKISFTGVAGILVAFVLAFSACQSSEKHTESTENTPAETPTTQSPTPQSPTPAAAAPTPSGQTSGGVPVTLGNELESIGAPATPGGLGSIQMQAMRDLWENCTSVDIIFYNTNFSLSQTDQEAIRATLGYFLPSPVIHNTKCKPIGRITFLVKGEIRREADMYVDDGCQYFLWMEHEKPVYINPMTPQGVAFFKQILKKGTSTFN